MTTDEQGVGNSDEPGQGGATGTRFLSRADKLGYTPPLDGMRGIGVMLVILVHATFEPFGAFAATVDMFFVVSGFLITTLLLEEDRRSGRVNLRRFYMRRALRLLPLMYLVLAGTLAAVFVVHLLTDNQDLLDKAISDVLAGGTYMYHVVHPVHVELVGGGQPEIRPLLHLWSLTVEEHFYLFGVLVVLVAVRKRWVTPLMVVFVTAWVVIGAARLSGAVGPNFAWYQRPDALLIGVALAFLHARMPATLSGTAGRRLRAGAWVAAAVILVVVWIGTWFSRPFGLFVPFLVPEGGSLHDGLYWGEFGFSVVSLGVCVIVITVARYPDHPIARVLSWRGFVAVGVRSYAIYLLHVPIGVLMLETVAKVSEPLFLLLYLPVLAVAAETAHRLVEKPAMRVKLKLAEPGASGARGR